MHYITFSCSTFTEDFIQLLKFYLSHTKEQIKPGPANVPTYNLQTVDITQQDSTYIVNADQSHEVDQCQQPKKWDCPKPEGT